VTRSANQHPPAGCASGPLPPTTCPALLPLPPLPQVNAYRRLSSVSAKVHSSEELAALLASTTQESLPALHTLVLSAQQGAGCRAAFGALRHAGLGRLVLHGVEAEGGFEGLELLEGGRLVPAGYALCIGWGSGMSDASASPIVRGARPCLVQTCTLLWCQVLQLGHLMPGKQGWQGT
jgi:hypothetical protein